MTELTEQTAGLPAAVLQSGRRLLSTGQLLSTADGLVRTSWNPSRAPADLGARLLRARRRPGRTGSARSSCWRCWTARRRPPS